MRKKLSSSFSRRTFCLISLFITNHDYNVFHNAVLQSFMCMKHIRIIRYSSCLIFHCPFIPVDSIMIFPFQKLCVFISFHIPINEAIAMIYISFYFHYLVISVVLLSLPTHYTSYFLFELLFSFRYCTFFPIS